jgi:hypothetical protein
MLAGTAIYVVDVTVDVTEASVAKRLEEINCQGCYVHPRWEFSSMPRGFITRSSLAVCLFFVPTGLVWAEDEWLEKYLPPKFEGGTPFTIKKVEVSRNHVDQEIIRVEYERMPEVIRSLAKEMKLVILPARGGRHVARADASIGISPRQSGSIGGITDSLLDYRGKIRGGARAYLEMTLANAIKKQDPVRVSNVFWMGSQEELQAAQKKDPPDPGNKELSAISLSGLADDADVPAGMPVRWAAGTHWYQGTVMEKGTVGKPLKLAVYLARPGGLYLPWYVSANRSDVKIETVALEAAKTDMAFFNDRLRAVKGRIGKGDAPFTLKAAGEKVSKGDRILWFGVHGLMGGEALEDSADSRVKVRDTRFKRESVLEVGQLFVDPSPPK